MAAFSEDRTIAAVISGARRAAQQHYRAAVAAQIRGDREAAAAAWSEFQKVTARAIVLSRLTGMAKYARFLRLRSDAALADDGAPLPKMDFSRRVAELFDRVGNEIDISDFGEGGISAGFEVGLFVEAVERFRGRVPKLASVVKRLAETARFLSVRLTTTEALRAVPSIAQRSTAISEALRRSFWVSDVDEATTINLRELVASAIEGGISVTDGKVNGVDLPEFIDQAQLQGAAHLSDARLEVVYRNNLNSAFNEGQLDVAETPEAEAVVPLLMLSEIHDKRTRGAPGTDNPGKHWQMHGYINTAAEFRRQGIVPPAGHNCRGGLRPVSVAEALRLGLLTDTGAVDQAALMRYNGARQTLIDSGQYPDPGWINRAA